MPPIKRVRGETIGVSPTTPSTEVEPHQTEALSMPALRFDAIEPFRVRHKHSQHWPHGRTGHRPPQESPFPISRQWASPSANRHCSPLPACLPEKRPMACAAASDQRQAISQGSAEDDRHGKRATSRLECSRLHALAIARRTLPPATDQRRRGRSLAMVRSGARRESALVGSSRASVDRNRRTAQPSHLGARLGSHSLTHACSSAAEGWPNCLFGKLIGCAPAEPIEIEPVAGNRVPPQLHRDILPPIERKYNHPLKLPHKPRTFAAK